MHGWLAHYLDGESVETSVYGDHGTGYECGASLASHCKVPSNSSGFPKRRNGVCATIVLQRSLGDPSGLLINARFCSVRKNPGAMAFTRRALSRILIAQLPGHVLREIVDSGFCASIANHTSQWA